MRSNDPRIPNGWIINIEERSAGVYVVRAVANDGRRIETTSTDPERTVEDILRSVHDSNMQTATRLATH